ncbi:MAG: DUF6504 family protein [Actinomycetes bacterium]
MNHRYRSTGGSGEPIEVVEGQDGAPAAFCWRGRRYTVSAVVAAWVEALPWWVDRGQRDGQGRGQGAGQRHLWRVEAAPRTGTFGVYDLYRVLGDGSREWGLVRVID